MPYSNSKKKRNMKRVKSKRAKKLKKCRSQKGGMSFWPFGKKTVEEPKDDKSKPKSIFSGLNFFGSTAPTPATAPASAVTPDEVGQGSPAQEQKAQEAQADAAAEEKVKAVPETLEGIKAFLSTTPSELEKKSLVAKIKLNPNLLKQIQEDPELLTQIQADSELLKMLKSDAPAGQSPPVGQAPAGQASAGQAPAAAAAAQAAPASQGGKGSKKKKKKRKRKQKGGTKRK